MAKNKKTDLKEELEEIVSDSEKENPKEAPAEIEEESDALDESEDDENKDNKSDKKDTIIEDLNDRLKRQMAEFENFRKRSEKEKSQMYDMGAKAILEKILPVVDNFERGLLGVDDSNEDPFVQGMQMVYKQMMTSLDEAGLKPIEAVGETFNPDYHNAVMHIDDDEYGENEVIEELQKGYIYHDNVVRHSMVKVAN